MSSGSIIPTKEGIKYIALDHDLCRANIRPSIALIIKIPKG